MATKVIVTNYSALSHKGYTESAIKSVKKEVAALIKADKDRGLTTTVVDVSDKADMDQHHAPVVTSETDEKQNKDTIDAIHHSAKPDYLMILGSHDVIPHQALKNPYIAEDSEPAVPSDLPYASETTYAAGAGDPKNYINPSRVVGRLPDLTGGHDVAHLARLIGLAAQSSPAARKKYEDYFGLSAKVWKEGSERDLKFLFGNSTALHLVPPEGTPWKPPTPLGSRTQFVACHGAYAHDEWFGADENSDEDQLYPVALTTDDIKQNITYGTILAPVCCYGAQLFSTKTNPGTPLCSTYLDNGAVAFFGSTNIAYSVKQFCTKADLITRTFLDEVLKGQSSGYATLKARQDYAKQKTPLDPVDLKTLAQYILLGDPSLKPVEAPPHDAGTDPRSATAERRRQALITARTLERAVALPVPTEAGISPELEAALREIGRQHGFPPDARLSTYDEVWQGDSALLEGTQGPPRQHILHTLRNPAAPVRTDVVLIIREQRGSIVSIERLEAA
ncbi:C25 family cysteine peptidase [Actinoalloteichus caeruleus]|uniref:C25 family cysteine peptidase n=1 Tax=Actinoalloteichus cyanogriseus TaxID=2893586 RepID=UPI003BB87323